MASTMSNKSETNSKTMTDDDEFSSDQEDTNNVINVIHRRNKDNGQ